MRWKFLPSTLLSTKEITALDLNWSAVFSLIEISFVVGLDGAPECRNNVLGISVIKVYNDNFLKEVSFGHQIIK